MRGENPIKFLRIYPNIYNHPLSIKNYPNLDVDGKEIPPEDIIQELNILGCPMKGQQLQDYNRMLESDTKFGSFDQLKVMLSHIILQILHQIIKLKLVILVLIIYLVNKRLIIEIYIGLRNQSIVNF